MPLSDLSAADRATVLRCLQSVLYGGWFDLGDADCLLGVSEAELREIESAWPVDDRDPEGAAFLAVNNVLNEVCHGSGRPQGRECEESVGAAREEVMAIYVRWAKSHGLTWTGVR